MWTRLPEDLIQKIAEFGVSWELYQACSAWRSASEREFFVYRSSSAALSDAELLRDVLNPETLHTFVSENLFGFHPRSSSELTFGEHLEPFVKLRRLEMRNITNFPPHLPELKTLKVSHSRLLSEIPCYETLKELRLDACLALESLPEELYGLEVLELRRMDGIRCISDTYVELKILHMAYCHRISRIPDLLSLVELRAAHCNGLLEIAPLGRLEKLYLEANVNLAAAQLPKFPRLLG